MPQIVRTVIRRESRGNEKEAVRSGPPLFQQCSAGYFFFVAVFLAVAFFAVPHGPFDLQAMTILLFCVVILNVSQVFRAVNM